MLNFDVQKELKMKKNLYSMGVVKWLCFFTLIFASSSAYAGEQAFGDWRATTTLHEDLTACVPDPDSNEIVQEPWMATEGFHVPSAFSPNNDGQNDFLQVFVGADIFSFRLLIYNRWGEVMFESQNPTIVWDGSFNGSALNAGVYTYTVELTYTDLTQETRYGNITLIK